MKDPSLPVQSAVYAALTNSADLASAFGATPRVFDRVPIDAAGRVTATFPYVAIGEDQVTSEANACFDAASIFVTVHVWSRAVGKVEAKTIMAAVCLALDVKLDVDGFGVIGHEVETGPQHLTDADGLTSHSVVTFRYRLAPVANP
jgi:hypothetical protein